MPTRKKITVEMESIVHPGRIRHRDGEMYMAMRVALLKVVPDKPPGLPWDEIRQRVLAHLPEDIFPGGAKAGWWTKAVQLDLEAKGIIAREKTTPLRWHKL